MDNSSTANGDPRIEPVRRSAGAGRRIGSRTRRLIFSVLLAAGLLGFLEAAGAIYYRLILSESDREAVDVMLGLAPGEWNNVLRYRPHPYLNFISNPEYAFADGTRPHVEPGIRTTDALQAGKPPGTFRVVALGASTAYGFYAEDARKTWPALVEMGLQQTLGPDVQVVNAGIPNYTTFEMLGFAAMWLPELEPDLVLLNIGINDAFTVGFPDEGGPDNTRFRFSWNYRQLPGWTRRAMRASYLLRSLGGPLLTRNGYRVGDANGAMQLAIPSESEVRENVARATGKYYRRNLETLVLLARRTGAEVVLVTEPLNPAFESGLGFYYDAVSAAVVRNNRIAESIGEQQGIEVIDLYAHLRDPQLFVDAAHVNLTGMMRKAQTVYDGILPRVRRLRGVRPTEAAGEPRPEPPAAERGR